MGAGANPGDVSGPRLDPDEVVAKIKAMDADDRRPRDFARMLKVGRTSVYRVLNAPWAAIRIRGCLRTSR